MTDIISIARAHGRWAVKHDGGYLGFAETREEARRIGLHLVDWFGHRGREASFVEEEPRSFVSEAVGNPVRTVASPASQGRLPAGMA